MRRPIQRRIAVSKSRPQKKRKVAWKPHPPSAKRRELDKRMPWPAWWFDLQLRSASPLGPAR